VEIISWQEKVKMQSFPEGLPSTYTIAMIATESLKASHLKYLSTTALLTMLRMSIS
jgi:hypothetical protein